jgi:PAS domain S-box-containing protein
VARRVGISEPTGADTWARGESLTAVDVLPILLVDDRVENLRALEAVLQPLGHPLLLATSGAEALRLLLEHEVGLILLDVRMPELDGLETARLIKGRDRTRDVPIVFMTASPDEVDDVLRGYDVGALDYLLKPVDPDLLRTKVAVFAELEAGRRALQHSEALLRGAFEAAPIGKTVLDGAGRIVRANPAFARLLDREPGELQGVAVDDLAQGEDREHLLALLARVATGQDPGAGNPTDRISDDICLQTSAGREVLVEAVASTIAPTEHAEPSMLVQWVDLTARRRAEQARAELLLEQAARNQAESDAERLRTLQTISDALDSPSLDALLAELAHRLAELFAVETAEVQIPGELDEPMIVRVVGGRLEHAAASEPASDGLRWQEERLGLQPARTGVLRLGLPVKRALSAAEESLLREVAERAALAIRRVQLREQEHRIAEELQRGLLPKRLPDVPGIELVAHYQVAGLAAEAGGDWYDAFALPDGRVGMVVGDVTGRGVRAASTMGQMRSVTRAYALADEGSRLPGDVLTRVNRYQLALGDDELFTMVYAVVDPRERRLWFANAGHPPPLLRGAAGDTRLLEDGGGLMGVLDAVYDDYEVTLDDGAVLVLYSDGLVERRGESIDLGLRRLMEAAAGGPRDPVALCAHLLREVLPSSSRLHDDVTAMMARISAPAADS